MYVGHRIHIKYLYYTHLEWDLFSGIQLVSKIVSRFQRSVSVILPSTIAGAMRRALDCSSHTQCSSMYCSRYPHKAIMMYVCIHVCMYECVYV